MSKKQSLCNNNDLVGNKFGRLIVIRQSDEHKSGHVCWVCKCICGKLIIATSSGLKRGNVKSCGYLRTDLTRQRSYKHGHGGRNKQSPTYVSWSNMVRRCVDPHNHAYHNYGGRGIAVCQRWKKFEHFLADMGEAPVGYQIDRINNNDGYHKNNCRWVTTKINSRNRRNNHLITYNGKTKCIVDWSEECGISRSTLWARLYLYNWSIQKALTTPVISRRRK